MKKHILFLLAVVILAGCSLDEENQIMFEVLPIESIEFPESFRINEVYTIPVTFYRPTNCHAYNGIISNPNANERTLAISAFIVNDNCVELIDEDGLASNSFEFEVRYDYTYIFNIWKGKDDEGEDVFEVIEVPVEN